MKRKLLHSIVIGVFLATGATVGQARGGRQDVQRLTLLESD